MRKRTLTIILIAVVAVVGLVAYYFHTVTMNYVPGESMMNTIVPGDRIVSRKLSGEVKRGQVIVFQYPGNDTYNVSRVIGLPNETIEVRDKFVYVNGRALNEERVMVKEADLETNELSEISTEGKGPYRVYYVAGPEGEQARAYQNPYYSGPLRLPANNFFVMGDNRDNSDDSRWAGPVPRELISGEVFMIYFSSTVDSNEVRWNRYFKRVP